MHQKLLLTSSYKLTRRVYGKIGTKLTALISLFVLGLLTPTASLAGGSEAIELPGFEKLDLMWPAIWIVFACAVIGLLFGAKWYFAIMKEDPGSRGMVEVSRAVQEGAWAYLKRQIKTMIWFVIIIAIGLIFMYKPLDAFNPGGKIDAVGWAGIPVYVGVGIAFVLGVAASYCAGLVGMMMAVRANVRVANAALSSCNCRLMSVRRVFSVLYVPRTINEGSNRIWIRWMSCCTVYENRWRNLH